MIRCISFFQCNLRDLPHGLRCIPDEQGCLSHVWSPFSAIEVALWSTGIFRFTNEGGRSAIKAVEFVIEGDNLSVKVNYLANTAFNLTIQLGYYITKAHKATYQKRYCTAKFARFRNENRLLHNQSRLYMI